MPGFAFVVVGASLGGVEALQQLVSELKPDIPAALLVVQHIGRRPSCLPELLSRAGPLPADHAKNSQLIRRGRIYVAPPDHHLTVLDGATALTRGPRENWARPAIDPLFRSAAQAQGPRTIGVILTGSLNDGTAGLKEVRARGGTAIVQHPSDAVCPMMPMSALRHAGADFCVRLQEIPPLLHELAVRVVETENNLAATRGMLRRETS
jgi:two-component system chemotaxis response regulator CheB